MRQFKAEFEAAKAAQDWTKVTELWKDLLIVAEIEETSDGLPDGLNKELALRRNAEASGQMQGGKKI